MANKKIEDLTQKSSPIAADWLVLADSADTDGDGDFKTKKVSPSDISPFDTSSNVTSNANGTQATDDFVFGSDSLDDSGSADNDSRFMFDKSKSSFFAGQVTGTEWDDASRGSYCAVFGYNNTVTGDGGLASGLGHSIPSGSDNATCLGNTNEVADDSTLAIGNNSKARYFGSIAQAATYNSANGDAQKELIVVKNTTTGAVTANLTPAAVAGNRIVLPASTLYAFEVEVIGVQTGGATGSAGDMWKYRIKGLIKRDGSNNTTYVSAAEEKTIIYEDDATCDVALTADDVNEALQIEVTGAANRNINWLADVKLLELSWV